MGRTTWWSLGRRIPGMSSFCPSAINGTAGSKISMRFRSRADLPTRMPIDSAVGLASYGPDGHTIAYNRIFRNFRTWKRYNGGLAQQVFTYDFNTHELKQLTHWSGTNTSPMWYGNRIYYLSDQDANRRANIWVMDTASKQTREVTHFTDYDIDFPALGGDAIAFQQGGKLYRLDLPERAPRGSSRLHPRRRSAHSPPRGRRQRRDSRDRSGTAGGLRAGAERQADAVLSARAIFSAYRLKTARHAI